MSTSRFISSPGAKRTKGQALQDGSGHGGVFRPVPFAADFGLQRACPVVRIPGEAAHHSGMMPLGVGCLAMLAYREDPQFEAASCVLVPSIRTWSDYNAGHNMEMVRRADQQGYHYVATHQKGRAPIVGEQIESTAEGRAITGPWRRSSRTTQPGRGSTSSPSG